MRWGGRGTVHMVHRMALAKLRYVHLPQGHLLTPSLMMVLPGVAATGVPRPCAGGGGGVARSVRP